MKWSLGISLESVTVLSPYVLFSRKFNERIMAFFLVCQNTPLKYPCHIFKDLLQSGYFFFPKIQISKCKMISTSSVLLGGDKIRDRSDGGILLFKIIHVVLYCLILTSLYCFYNLKNS